MDEGGIKKEDTTNNDDFPRLAKALKAATANNRSANRKTKFGKT
jgi:hypothetical protein